MWKVCNYKNNVIKCLIRPLIKMLMYRIQHEKEQQWGGGTSNPHISGWPGSRQMKLSDWLERPLNDSGHVDRPINAWYHEWFNRLRLMTRPKWYTLYQGCHRLVTNPTGLLESCSESRASRWRVAGESQTFWLLVLDTQHRLTIRAISGWDIVLWNGGTFLMISPWMEFMTGGWQHSL